MKMTNKILTLLAASAIFASCTLDTAPEGGTVTSEQKQEVVEMIPERIAADVTNLAATMFTQYSVGGSNRYAIDFGYPSICIAYDYNGPDMIGADNDYNWYTPACDYTDRNPDYIVPYVEWTFYYNYLKAANDILAAIPASTQNQTLKYYRGQALGARAFTLFNLVQRFQFTYKGHEGDPTIPVVLEDMPAEQASNNPRASAESVYARIMGDLNEAIGLLEGYNRPNKSTIDQKVAYGLRARVNLVMNNWAAAASDADKALAGATPYSIAEVGKPTFQYATHNSWIWGCEISESDITGSMIHTWQSWLGALNNGYATQQACYPRCNIELYKRIPATDVRKGWWVDTQLKSPLIDNLTWPGHAGKPIGPLVIPQKKMAYTPYTSVKFGPEGDVIGTTNNSGDWPLMRAEEMYLTKAEATAMAGDLPGGKNILEQFVKTYRDPSFTSKATTVAAFQNECWFQRRVELWGEGFAPMDMMRLKRPLVRFREKTASNYPNAFRFNIAPDNGIFLCRIPQDEINANEGISPEQNNNGGTYPTPDEGEGLMDGVTD